MMRFSEIPESDPNYLAPRAVDLSLFYPEEVQWMEEYVLRVMVQYTGFDGSGGPGGDAVPRAIDWAYSNAIIILKQRRKVFGTRAPSDTQSALGAALAHAEPAVTMPGVNVQNTTNESGDDALLVTTADGQVIRFTKSWGTEITPAPGQDPAPPADPVIQLRLGAPVGSYVSAIKVEPKQWFITDTTKVSVTHAGTSVQSGSLTVIA